MTDCPSLSLYKIAELRLRTKSYMYSEIIVLDKVRFNKIFYKQVRED